MSSYRFIFYFDEKLESVQTRFSFRTQLKVRVDEVRLLSFNYLGKLREVKGTHAEGMTFRAYRWSHLAED